MLQKIIDKMGSVAIDTNYMSNHNWGVLFNTSEDGDEAWIVGEAYAVRFTGVGQLNYNKNAPFYNVEEGEWTRNTISTKVNSTTSAKMTITPMALHEKLEYVRPKTEDEVRAISNQTGIPEDDINEGAIIKYRVPFGSFYNLVNHTESKVERKRERVIIKPTPFPLKFVKDGNIILEAVPHEKYGVVLSLGEFGYEIFPGVPKDKFWTVDNTSLLQTKDMVPGRLYECYFPDIMNDLDVTLNCNTTVKVRSCVYKGLNIMVHYSKSGYLMNGETVEDVINTNLYTEGFNMIRLPLDERIDPNYFDNLPVMLDCNILACILDIYKGFEYIDINVSPNPKDLILIEGVRGNDSYPIIQTILSPLDNKVGDIR